MAGNLSDCVPSIINGKLIWYAWKNNHNTFYEINLSDLSSNHATRIENGHKYVYGTTVENNQVDKTCRVCGITSKAAVPTKISAYITPSNSSYHTLNGSDFLTKDLTYTVDWSTWFSGDSGDDYLPDCTISCSDNNVLTIQQTSDSVAVITPKKSGKATLTIQSKYNPSVVFTSELYVDMLSEDVFTFSHGYIGYYDGTKKDPEVKIYRSGLTLTEGTDYTATYNGDQVNAGTFTVTFKGIGKYTGTVKKEYTIKPDSIYSSSTTCTLSPDTCIYDGKPQEPKVTITKGDRTLVEGRDYTVEYQNNTSIGRARAGITGIGNYSGYFTTAFYINRGSISNCDITLSDTSLTYDGTEKKPLVTVKCNGNTLTEDQDYYLYYRSNTNAGTASVTISGTGNFYSSASKTFQIKPADISKYTAALSQDSFNYDGSEKCPDMTITNGNAKLTYNTDYSLSYKNNVNTGTASVTATGKGNYTGSVTKTFQIKASDFSKCDIQLSASSFTYDGTEKKPEITVKSGSKLLVSGTDYAVSYSNNINVGTASVTITGKGKYSGTITKAFSINPADFTKASVTLSASSFTWDGTEKKPNVTVKIGNRQLIANTDYTVSYKNNVSVGTASVTLTAKGNYTGSVSKNFSITAADFTKTSVSLSASSFTYDGAEKKPGITVKNDSKLLTANTDYTVSYKNNINAGTASVTITGKGSYSGSQTKSFTINPADFTRTTVSLSASSFIYDGAEKKPEVTVKTGNTQLTPNKDYTISYKNNTNVGTASVTVTGKSNYSGSQTKDFTITAATFTGVTVTLSNSAFTYDGTEKKPGVTVKAGSKLLSAGKDYTLAYTDNINAGTATVTVTGKGSYSGSAAKNFTINPADFTKASVTLSASSFTWDGTEKKPEVTVKIGNRQLTANTDYTVSYKNNVSVGTASVTLTAKGNYTGSVSKNFSITAADFTKTSVSLSASSFTYDGAEKKPGITVKNDSKLLTANTDYTVSYKNNINAGTASVTITGKGSYSGSQTKDFTINPADFTRTTVSLSASSFIYDGAEKKPEVTVKTGNTQLTLTKDSTVSYKNNPNVGAASVTVTGKGNYSGSQTKNFTITAATFTGVTVALSASAFTYDGTEKKPGVTVKAGSKLLSADKDYTIAYENNVNAGTASVIITGNGSYSGSTAKSFTINPADLSKASITLSASSFIYDGTEKKPEVTISIDQKQLSEETDYTLSYKNNTNIGTASVTASGTGNYTGSISKSFTIAATDLSTADVKLSAASFTYNGKAITPSVTITCNDKVLTNGTDYSVAYTSNINAGTARATITGIGAYSGVKTVTFRIKRAKATLTPTAAALTLTQSSRKTAVIKHKKTDGKISLKSSNSKIVKISGTSIIPLSPGKATVTITAAQGKNYNAVSAKISISVRPLPVSTLSLKSSAKGQATASWKQVKSITSYQIQYSTASSMKSAKTITVKGTSKSAVLKKLTRGKKYYVRIRTVKTVSKKNYYSTWSKTASVKVK